MEKLHEYQGFSGRVHEWRDNVRAKLATWREDHEGENLVDLTKSYARRAASGSGQGDKGDYSHIYRSVSHSVMHQRLNIIDFTPNWLSAQRQ
jgi:solute carrier family 45, member 1/2/4